MSKALEEKIKKFPKEPGVYIMKDEVGTVIYVGKAKSLNTRIKSYFREAGDGRYQVKFLMKRVSDIEFILSATEEQAFILERDLINKYKPRYNIRLKDDKAYLSIRIDENAKWPRLELTRKVLDDGAKYFGPYTSSYELRTLLDIINKSIPLRTCRDTVLKQRTRPCLEYQIKRCVAPCCLEVDRVEYDNLLKQAVKVLEGKSEELVQVLEEKMELASAELRFEDAANYRDRVEILKSFKNSTEFISTGAEHRDVFAIYRDERFACLSVLNVRFGRIANNTNYVLKDLEVDDEAVIHASISQYYSDGKDLPEEVIVPLVPEEEELLLLSLKNIAKRKVEITVPKQGLKYRLLKLALLNAKEHYTNTFNIDDIRLACAKKLAKLLKLENIPRRIECIDISNFQGSDIVGAVVSYKDGVKEKDSYKRYKISFQDKPDDFKAIYEVVFRRLKQAFKDGDQPDLLLIDGGKGQLQAALKARDELGMVQDIASIAKIRKKDKKGKIVSKPERLFREGANEPIVLEANDALTNFVAGIRDEVHRFVITFHRTTRSKRVFSSELDSIPGIGPERKKRLLRIFKSVDNIKVQDAQTLATKAKMPLGLMEKVLIALKD